MSNEFTFDPIVSPPERNEKNENDFHFMCTITHNNNNKKPFDCDIKGVW